MPDHQALHDWCSKTGLTSEWDGQDFVALDLPAEQNPPDMAGLAVEHILGMLAAGDDFQTLLDGYPRLEREDILA